MAVPNSGEEKTNEHKAVLLLLEGLVLEGRLVTGDAMFCQRDFCQQAISPASRSTRWTLEGLTATISPSSIMKASRR
jgi:predicted transposase YbfD/YdcC